MMHPAKLLCLVLPAAIALASCTSSMPSVPASNHGRTVVAPRGSSEGYKPWSNPTKQEGDAALGPLSGLSERR
ncbi:MAG: hypothetical protein Q4C88_07745 [Akkermansia sp.]|nr:hypothetical protein [Akkermansia sp.]